MPKQFTVTVPDYVMPNYLQRMIEQHLVQAAVNKAKAVALHQLVTEHTEEYQEAINKWMRGFEPGQIRVEAPTQVVVAPIPVKKTF